MTRARWGLTPFRRFAPAWLALGVLAACGDAHDPTSQTSVRTASDAAPESAVIITAPDAAGDRDSSLGFDSSVPDATARDAGIDAGPQPVVACHGEGGSEPDAADGAPECELPPSRCVDGRTLLYYRDGRCIDGRCRWDEALFRCQVSCGNDGCIGNFTAPAAP